MLGGGLCYFLPEHVQSLAFKESNQELLDPLPEYIRRQSRRTDRRDLLAEARAKGYRLAHTRQQMLQAISVGELAEVLNAEFLALPDKKDVLVEHLLVGAMSVEQALPYIRRVSGAKAMITGGDRADMHLVALETATRCLILTGHLHPMPEVLRRAEEVGVPVLLVRGNTMDTVETIESVYGKTRLGQEAKLQQFELLLEEHFDFGRLYQALDLE